MEKTENEIFLDNKYVDIVKSLKDILDLLDFDKNRIDEKLDSGEILQVEFDNRLLDLIEVIRG